MFWSSPPWNEVVYWSLDLETGGLDPRHDAILSVGMLPIREGVIRLGEAYATLVRPGEADGYAHESIQAHQLVPSELAGATPLPAALDEIDARLREGALLVHHAAIDVGFLKRAYKRAGRRWPSPPVVDTVHLLMKAAQRARFVDPAVPETEPELNLAAARKLLGLPEYAQHDALTDSVATAELFLVLRRQLGAKTLRDLR